MLCNCIIVTRVTEHKAKNMMTSENLAIVFAPTLMRSPDSDPMLNLMSVGAEQKSVELLISCARELFLKWSKTLMSDWSILQWYVEWRLYDNVLKYMHQEKLRIS